MLPNQQGTTGPMSWLTKAMPSISTGLGIGSALVGSTAQARALSTNAQTYQTEGATAARQGYEQEAQQRITGAKVIGAQTAAAGAAGAGYQGSTGRMIAQSARNVELDALNTRYKAQLQKWSFGAQAQNLGYESGVARAGGILKAGAALLRGYSGNYTGNSPFQYYPVS